MKRSAFILSLSANIFLFLALIAFVIGRHAPPASSGGDSGIQLVASAHTVNPTAAFTFHPTTNMAQLIAEMRAAKVPDPLLARMIAADFEERWQQRQRAMQEKFNRGDIDEVELEQFNEEHDAEQENDMRTALGDAGFRQWDQENVLRDFEANKASLSGVEKDAIYDLKKKLARQQHELNLQMQSGEIDAMDCNQQQSAAQTEYDTAVKALLGDQRFMALQNGDDGQAGNLRRSLRALNASDEQFQALLDAQKKWNEQRSALDQRFQEAQGQSQDYAAQLQSIDASRDQEYQNVLGTNGVVQLQMQQDDRYQTMKHFATPWQLSDADINFLYHTLQYYDKTVQDYQRQAQALQQQGQAVDWKGVQANVKQFANQTMDGFINYLGNDRFQRMKNNGILNIGQSEEVASGGDH